jgi:hypothetical protein
MITSVSDLSAELHSATYKQGYFFYTDKRDGDYWIDLYSMSHLFNVSKNAKGHRARLKELVKEVVLHQKNVERGINSIIIPRWTQNTEDLFTETLLNICFELSSESAEFNELAVYELFSAGGDDKNDFYMSLVESLEGNKEPAKIKAIALLALDIHSWIIDFLLDNPVYKDIQVTSVISVVGRCGQFPTTNKRRKHDEESKFKIFPLFDASFYKREGEEKVFSQFQFIMAENTMLHEKLFGDEDFHVGIDRYIPISKWRELL